MNKITNLFFAAILFCGYNLTVSAQPIEIIFTSATNTLTQSDVNAKLSEYDADELAANGFIAIIDDDIVVIGERAFYADFEFGGNPINENLVEVIGNNVARIGVGAFIRCIGLTMVYLPNVIIIETQAFNNCSGLTSIVFPNVISIKHSAFSYCSNLISINFPRVTAIESYAFYFCYSLTSANFGTYFFMPTEIDFGHCLFGINNDLTEQIDLTLGEYVLPSPDLDANTWLTNNWTWWPPFYIPYTWKSITTYSNIEEAIKKRTVNIYPNPTVGDATVTFELEKSCNLKIVLTDLSGRELFTVYDGFTVEEFFSKTFNIVNLVSGIYFLQILIDGKYTVAKLVVE